MIGVLPWLASVIHSVELPGGFKIELQDVKAATDKVTRGKTLKSTSARPLKRADTNIEFLNGVVESSPSLALVGLRIEIEKRLRMVARDLNLASASRSVGVLLADLLAHDRIDGGTAAGLDDLIALGNQAAHGVEVSSDAARWAMDTGPLVLQYLDNLVVDKQTN